MSYYIVTLDGKFLDNVNQCTLDTCDMIYAFFTYLPNFAGNLILVIIFGLLIIPQAFFGIRYKTWGYMIGMLGGLLLEVIGYVGRILLHNNPFIFDNFLLYLICLTLGPAFFTASIYLCLARIVIMYGEEASRIKPRTYTILFVSCDFLSLVLQGAGGGVTSTANDHSTQQMGINIMIAGLSTQVASLALFMIICTDFALRIRRSPHMINTSTEAVRKTFKWKAFLFCLFIATVTIFVRSVFRVAELREGFDGPLANDEITFMVLEGAMIVIACICLTAFHPGISFGGKWDQSNFTFRTVKTQRDVQASPPWEMMPPHGQHGPGSAGMYESDNSLKDRHANV